jgi:hypothetical protein
MRYRGPVLVIALETLLFTVLPLAPAHARKHPPRPGPQSDLVVTPFGRFPRACVHQVPAGARVGPDGTVSLHGKRIASYGTTCPEAGRILLPDSDSYKAYGYGWAPAAFGGTGATTFSELDATFTVPPAPTKVQQAIFFFPGLEPADGSAILQPIVQWGQPTGNFQWTLASVYLLNHQIILNVGGVPVPEGEVVRGVITNQLDRSDTCNSTGHCAWDVFFDDLTLGITLGETYMRTETLPSTYPYAFNGVLETYFINDCKQLPPSGSMQFYDVGLFDRDYNNITSQVRWGIAVPPVPPPDCQYAARQVDGGVTISWNPN